jgi:hypothetical protein
MSLKITALAALAGATLAFSAAASASPPIATIAGGCGVGTGEGYGYTYLLKLSVKGTSCTTGKKVVRHKGRLSGWHCSKKVLQQDSIQVTAKMTCNSGRRHVTYTYSQNK